jgi:short-subunit dehydrogenase
VALALLIGNTDGIGLALTRLLLADGWRVVGVSRSPSVIEAPAYQHHVLDVCATDYAPRLCSIVSQLEPIDVCVYCVGIGEFLDIENMSPERRVFETNLLGAVSTAEVVVPPMIQRSAGHFIGLSSQADGVIDANAPSYAASKAGLSSYLEGLALACKPRGVSVTNVRFGFVDTKMAKSDVKPFMVSPELAARRIRRCIEKRPMRDTYPKRMAVLLWLLGSVARLRRFFA